MKWVGKILVGVLAIILAVPIVAALNTGPVSAGGAPKATVDPTLTAAVTGGIVSTFRVIVTFWSDADMGLLDAVAPNTKLTALPSAYALLTADQISTVASWPEVRSVWDAGERYEIVLEQGRELVRANEVQAMGITGEGITVAVIDTGIDATHPDLPFGTKVIENWEVLGFNDFGLRGCVFASSVNTDDDGHGTHVSGTIAGTGAESDGRFRGIAPGAKLIGYSTNVGIFILSSSALCAFDDIVARAGTTGVRAVSNSWGGGTGVDYNPDNPISVAIERAFGAGIVSVFAAGNSGPEDNTMTSRFSTSPFVVGVGAITKPKELVMFSSRGRPDGNHDRDAGIASNSGLYRPTVVAPGVRITAPTTGGGYATLSGTSMATPHVSGVVALILSANPDLAPLQVMRILEGTAASMDGYLAHEVGAGLADAFAGVSLALELGSDPSTPIPPGRFVETPPTISRVDTTEFPSVTMVGSSTTADPATAEVIQDFFLPVDSGAVRLYVDIEWMVDAHNFYLFLYRPGADPATDFPAQEATGLLDVPLTFRFADARNPAPGEWRIRILARVNTVDAVVTNGIVSYGATETPPDQLGVSLHIRKSEKEVPPGDQVAYAIRLTNTGTVPTSYRIEASGAPDGWQTALTPVEVDLAPGQTVLVRLLVGAPHAARDGDVASIVVTATSVPEKPGGPTVSESVATTTTVRTG